MTELLARAERDGIPLAPRTEAIALYFTRAVAYWQDPGVDVLPGLQSSAALFDESGDPASGALARVSVALAYLSAPTGPDLPAARAALEQGLAGFSGAGDSWGQAMTLVTLGRIDLAMQDVPGAAGRFEESYRLASSAGEMLGIVDRAAPPRLAQALLGRHRRRRGGLRRVARHVGRDAPRRGHRLRTRRARGGARRAGRRGAGRPARRGRAEPASAHGVC